MSGFTNVPNALWDWQIDNQMLPNVQRIFALVARYTICFHRTHHEISLSFIENRTGIKRSNASIILKQMINDRIITEKTVGQKRYLGLYYSEPVMESNNTAVMESHNTTVMESHNQESKQSKLKNINNDLFDHFWSEYPKKVSKPQAIKAFGTAVKKVSFEIIMNGLDGYNDFVSKQIKETKFIKHPATWLNAEGWNDYKPTEQVSRTLQLVQAQSEKEKNDYEYEKLRELYRKTGTKIAGSCSGIAR